jgi:hypothetical protein
MGLERFKRVHRIAWLSIPFVLILLIGVAWRKEQNFRVSMSLGEARFIIRGYREVFRKWPQSDQEMKNATLEGYPLDRFPVTFK